MEERESMDVEDKENMDNYTLETLRLFTKWKIKKNLFIISLAFHLLFVAFISLQNLQSSLNKEEGLGTLSLSLIYTFSMISGLLLPPFVINRLGCKWTMVGSMLGYLLFMAANMYAVWATLIPASILVGIGCSLLWGAKSIYVTRIAKLYAKITGAKPEGVISTFFGIFFMVFQTSHIWGNLIASTIFRRNIKETRNISDNIYAVCGADYCPGDYRNNTNLDRPDDIKIYTLCGAYIGCAVIAMTIMATILDNLPNEESTKTKSPKVLVLAVIYHLRSSRFQKLLVPLSIYSGVSKAFIAGDFTRSFVSCSLGVWYVGHIMIAFGVANAVSSFLVGRIVSVAGFAPCFLASLFIHGGAFTALLLLRLDDKSIFLFYVFSCLLGIGDAIIQTLSSSLHGHLFPDSLDAGFTSYKLGESLGFTIAFGYSSFLCTNVKIYVTLALLVVGLTLYVIVDVTNRQHLAATEKTEESMNGENEIMNIQE